MDAYDIVAPHGAVDDGPNTSAAGIRRRLARS